MKRDEKNTWVETLSSDFVYHFWLFYISQKKFISPVNLLDFEHRIRSEEYWDICLRHNLTSKDVIHDERS